MNKEQQNACEALAHRLANYVVKHDAGLDEAIVFNSFIAAGCAYAASHGRSVAEIREVLARIADNLPGSGISGIH